MLVDFDEDDILESTKDELRFRLACLFNDCDELLKSVCKSWEDVRNEKTTFLAATSLTLVAVKQSEALVSQFQLLYPAFKSVEDIYTSGVREWLPSDAVEKSRRISTSNFLATHMEGALLADFMIIGQMLASFTSAIPKDKMQQLVPKKGFFGPSYNENSQPIQDANGMSRFLLQELTVLYNNYVNVRSQQPEREKHYSAFKVLGFVLTQLETFFETQEVSLSLVFSVACWMKSVIILQGDRRIGRICGMTKTALLQLQQSVRVSAETRQLSRIDPSLSDVLYELCVDKVSNLLDFDRMYHKNPVLSGALLLEISLDYLHLSCQAIHTVANQFRMVMHLYNALVKCDLMAAGSIPLLDSLYPVYERFLFKPSRDGAKPGDFVKTFLLSGHFKIETVRHILHGTEESLKGKRCSDKISRKQRLATAVHGDDISELYRILVTEDMRRVYTGASGAVEILSRVAQIAKAEHTELPRVLGLCLLTISDSFLPLLNTLFAQLPSLSEGLVVSDECPDVHEAFVARALGILDLAATSPDSDLANLVVTKSPVMEKLARVTAIHYKVFTARHELHFLSGRRDMFTEAFGSVSLSRIERAESTQIEAQLFSDHMSVFEKHTQNGTSLTEEEKQRLMEDVRRHPNIRFQSDSANGLGLLHYAVWSPTVKNSDRVRLVEWLVQMGFNDVHIVVDHGRGMRPVHLCAQHNKLQTLHILLSYSEYKDIDFVTSTGETCLSLASRGGHYEIICYLIEHGACMRKDCRSTLLSQCSNLSAAEKIEKTQSLLKRMAMFEAFNGPQSGAGIGARNAEFAQQSQARHEMTREALLAMMRQQAGGAAKR
eukprot:gene25971-32483_t